MMKFISYLILIAMTSLFASMYGMAYECHDSKKKKALWINATAFVIGFVAGMLLFI